MAGLRSRHRGAHTGSDGVLGFSQYSNNPAFIFFGRPKKTKQKKAAPQLGLWLPSRSDFLRRAHKLVPTSWDSNSADPVFPMKPLPLGCVEWGLNPIETQFYKTAHDSIGIPVPPQFSDTFPFSENHVRVPNPPQQIQEASCHEVAEPVLICRYLPANQRKKPSVSSVSRTSAASGR
jgi:hypothetical protein